MGCRCLKEQVVEEKAPDEVQTCLVNLILIKKDHISHKSTFVTLLTRHLNQSCKTVHYYSLAITPNDLLIIQFFANCTANNDKNNFSITK